MGLPVEHLTIVPATKEQSTAAYSYIHNAWGQGLTVDQFITRAAAIGDLGIARGTKTITWVLVPRNDTQTLDFLSSCESYRRMVALSSAGEEHLKMGWGYWIDSVYTRTQHRKNGYAKHMMQLLHHALAQPSSLPPFPPSWGAPPHPFVPKQDRGILSVLHSIVGSEFYATCGPTPSTKGWVGVPRSTTVWDTSRWPKSLPTNGATRQLDEPNVYSILRQNQNALLLDLTSDGPPGRRKFTFLPADHFIEPQIAFCKLTPSMSNPKIAAVVTNTWGATLCQNPTQFAVWTYEALPAPSRLSITHLRASDDSSFSALLSAAMQAALEVGMH